MRRWLTASLCCLAILATGQSQRTQVAQDAPKPPAAIELSECLVLPAVGAAGRSPVRVDPLELRLIRNGIEAPKTGDKVPRHNGGEAEWKAAKADDEGWVGDREFAGGYAWWSVRVDSDATWLLAARGHSAVYVNGALRGGDPYNYGKLALPVQLKAGDNHLLLLMGRGRVKAELRPLVASSSGILIGDDWTLPDLVHGAADSEGEQGAVDIVNATAEPVRLRCVVSGFGQIGVAKGAALIQPMSVRKVAFRLPVHGDAALGKHSMKLDVRLGDAAVATREFDVEVKAPLDKRKVTFVSDIDGSVQYYGLVPAKLLPGRAGPPGILLSLHGASVEAIGQAGAYSPKSWCHIVCPTNRRSFGFDWEDWGRLDAMEVLAHAKATLNHDPSRVWLTGHSMGGHGAWTVGAHFPDQFAAVGPSAGWESFWSYAGGGGHPPEYKVSPILTRTANPSRTLLMKQNYAQQGIYILHGDADDNVPVTEARNMRDALKEFHKDLQYHEEPGAGHWWNRGNDDGADCVDWAPMMDMFARRRLPAAGEVMSVDFTTVCLGNSDKCHWVSVHMQQTQLEPSRVQLTAEPNRGRILGTTTNVRTLRVDLADILQPREHVVLELDGGSVDVPWPDDGRLWVTRTNEGWQTSTPPSPRSKGPHRYGVFKNAMRNRFILVYGTQGTEAEKAWMFNKARFDAEQWLYRANGSVDVVSDSQFDIEQFRDRDVVLYGNAATNSAFAILADAPIALEKGKISLGGRVESGSDLAMLFCYPRADSDAASVCVVGGTGIEGMRLTDRLAYFVSGAAFPDVIFYGPEMLESGTGGVRMAGFFSEDWKVEGGEFVWRDEK
jgi:dienelactone hydrolase